MSTGVVYTASIQGLEVKIVRAEADLSNGLPMFHMVGYLASEVKEAGDRVRTAIRNSGIEIPVRKTVVNLSPGNIRKRGPSFDLPIALAVLAAAGCFEKERLEGALAVGELGLGGEIRAVPGVLPIVWEARKSGCRTCIVPPGNRAEAELVEGIRILACRDLRQLCGALVSGQAESQRRKAPCLREKEYGMDFREVRGQETVRRAAEIAVAGGHNFLMIGPPGSGKSMIASRIPTILPPMTREESLELTKIYSIQSLLEGEVPLVTERPFREVHHTVTKAALVGGGAVPAPGELSLAHRGVLFLDELTEFPRPLLEALRQPLEEKIVRLTRKQGNYVFPADFMLVAAMNPCPCGYYPDVEKCTCGSEEVSRYLGKISQPLLGRIDICVDAPALGYEDMSPGAAGEDSAAMRQRICAAREVQRHRYQGAPGKVNAALTAREVEEHCALCREGSRVMQNAYDRIGLTARTYHKVLKVARTIADLDGSAGITVAHLQEAIGYRLPDKRYWGSIR